MSLPIVMSFGAGVQSTTLALLAADGDDRLVSLLGGVPDVYLFADTGDEPAKVYVHLERCRGLIEAAGSELHVVSQGVSLSKHLLDALESGKKSNHAEPPMWVADGSGRSAPMSRGCTLKFKLQPLNRFIREWAGIKRKRYPEPQVEVWIGISIDEASRMRDAKESWKLNRYPLIEMGWKRSHCVEYLEAKGVITPRSACSYCPFHNNVEWADLMSDPVERARIVAFERSVRSAWRDGGAFGVKTEPFLHRSRVPIDEVDFDGGQETFFSMWENECEGMCGV
tara:strand:+ start:1013 stop:1858 length:846 start_codon:yes stop_codon:yes gene_type:complete